MRFTKKQLAVFLGLLALLAAPFPLLAFELNDGHVHLTNYIQEGRGAKELLRIMGDKVGRAPIKRG